MYTRVVRGLLCAVRYQRRVILWGQLLECAAQPRGWLRGRVIARQLLPHLVSRADLLAAPQPPHVSLPDSPLFPALRHLVRAANTRTLELQSPILKAVVRTIVLSRGLFEGDSAGKCCGGRIACVPMFQLSWVLLRLGQLPCCSCDVGSLFNWCPQRQGRSGCLFWPDPCQSWSDLRCMVYLKTSQVLSLLCSTGRSLHSVTGNR